MTIMDDSAGDNLAMILTLFLRDHDLPLPCGVVLLSPWSDLSQSLPSVRDFEHFDFISDLQFSIEQYLGTPFTHALTVLERYVSPILDGIAPIAGTFRRFWTGSRPSPRPRQWRRTSTTVPCRMPPMYICVGGDETLLDSVLLLALRLARTGRVQGTHSPVMLEVYEHQVHMFPFMVPHCAHAAACIEQVGTLVETVVNAPIKPVGQPVENARFTLEARYFRMGHVHPASAATAFLLKRWTRIRGITSDARHPVGELELPVGVLASAIVSVC
ncbi:hypothetical protein AMAG_00822 [Allomyces macrogynus ATCC 38327]|uniref:Uncharacterized protein n=1 Tax=Allomyces macrogynus (strain ATCC 38327) TaxID=578462 RepID=A0A0L0RXM1_ALLM3|nr:hypothetical protein AMAG_00822 [Allomyces macrogynus ATCC 38327]|eukprot:KNE54874.1 hypothetical protein AMAG_00822 [Allomyces macrogynus ATCC 38327]